MPQAACLLIAPLGDADLAFFCSLFSGAVRVQHQCRLSALQQEFVKQSMGHPPSSGSRFRRAANYSSNLAASLA